MGTANFGLVGLDWQQRVNWQRMREYRIERAREMMKKHGLGAMLCMYDENVRYITGTLTPGWNRLNQQYAAIARTYDELAAIFEEQAQGLVEGGCDLMMGYHHPSHPVALDPGHAWLRDLIARQFESHPKRK